MVKRTGRTNPLLKKRIQDLMVWIKDLLPTKKIYDRLIPLIVIIGDTSVHGFSRLIFYCSCFEKRVAKNPI